MIQGCGSDVGKSTIKVSLSGGIQRSRGRRDRLNVCIALRPPSSPFLDHDTVSQTRRSLMFAATGDQHGSGTLDEVPFRP